MTSTRCGENAYQSSPHSELAADEVAWQYIHPVRCCQCVSGEYWGLFLAGQAILLLASCRTPPPTYDAAAVDWGPGAEPVALDHPAVVFSERELLSELRTAIRKAIFAVAVVKAISTGGDEKRLLNHL